MAAMLLCCSAVRADLSVPVRQPQSVTAGKVLTLADCIDLALKNQASIRQAMAQVEVQAGAVSQARSKLLPGTSVSGSTDLAGSANQNSGTTVTAGASQLIFDFSRTPSQIREAERARLAATETLKGTSANVILSVKQAYYTLLQDIHLVDVFTENLKDQQGHVAQAQARKDAGMAPLTDVLTAQTAEASARLDLVTAKNNADQARVNLNAAMGINVLSPIQIAEGTEPETPPLPEDQAVQVAFSKRPEIRADAYQIMASQAAVKVASTGNLPALTTSAERSHSTVSSASGQNDSWQWTLNLVWTPIDFGSTSGAVRSAKAQVVSAEETLYNDKQTIAGQVVQARLGVLAAEEQLREATAEVASAKATLDSVTGSYQAGVAIFLQVLDAQSAMLKAEVDEFSARYGLSIARATLEHAMGGTVKEGV